MTGDRKIKKFGEFEVTPGLRRNLNHLQISGKTAGGFLKQENLWKVDVWWSPIRGKIIEIENLDSIDLPFGQGDHFSEVLKWQSTNGHKITMDVKRI